MLPIHSSEYPLEMIAPLQCYVRTKLGGAEGVIRKEDLGASGIVETPEIIGSMAFRVVPPQQMLLESDDPGDAGLAHLGLSGKHDVLLR